MLTPLISSRAKTGIIFLHVCVSQRVQDSFPPVVYIPLISKRSLSLLLSNLVCADIGVYCTVWLDGRVGMIMGATSDFHGGLKLGCKVFLVEMVNKYGQETFK